MSKTLTEQWREGKLPDGYYYIDYDTQQRIFEVEDGCATYHGLPAETYFLNDVCLIKVLGPVPSYDEYRELLDLNVYEKDRKKVMGLEDKVERLQEQLKEANKVIKKYSDGTIYLFPTWYNGSRLAEAYLKKWGVK